MRRWAFPFGLLVLAIILAADFGLLGPARRLHALPLADKVGHFLLFGSLNLIVVRAMLQFHRNWRRARTAAVYSMVLLALAGLEEWSQLYIGSRTFSAWDFAASALGIATFGLVAALWPRSDVGNQNGGVMDRRV